VTTFGAYLDARCFEGDYRPGDLNDLLSAPADLNAFIASLLDIASDVLRWDIDQAFACLGFSSGRFQFHAVP
jgi:hypothetical protein